MFNKDLEIAKDNLHSELSTFTHRCGASKRCDQAKFEKGVDSPYISMPGKHQQWIRIDVDANIESGIDKLVTTGFICPTFIVRSRVDNGSAHIYYKLDRPCFSIKQKAFVRKLEYSLALWWGADKPIRGQNMSKNPLSSTWYIVSEVSSGHVYSLGQINEAVKPIKNALGMAKVASLDGSRNQVMFKAIRSRAFVLKRSNPSITYKDLFKQLSLHAEAIYPDVLAMFPHKTHPYTLNQALHVVKSVTRYTLGIKSTIITKPTNIYNIDISYIKELVLAWCLGPRAIGRRKAMLIPGFGDTSSRPSPHNKNIVAVAGRVGHKVAYELTSTMFKCYDCKSKKLLACYPIPKELVDILVAYENKDKQPIPASLDKLGKVFAIKNIVLNDVSRPFEPENEEVPINTTKRACNSSVCLCFSSHGPFKNCSLNDIHVKQAGDELDTSPTK